MNKKTINLLVYALCVLVLIKVMLVQDDDIDRSKSPTWGEVERAYNERNSEFVGDMHNPQPTSQKSQ